MPLRDHFNPPLSQKFSWQEVHGQWPAVIVQHLGKVLPPNYVAGPSVYIGSQIEVDIATFENSPRTETSGDSRFPGGNGSSNGGGVAAPVWAPAEPSLAIETELVGFTEYEVRVYDVIRDRRLVAAIELVSPANQDRPESRLQFVSKCAAMLREQVSIVLVDVCGNRNFNLYAELLTNLKERDPLLSKTPAMTYAVSCCWHPRPQTALPLLETWYRPLTIGGVLPVLPLWLSADLAIPLDLEASYEQTCRDLRIA